MNTALWCCIAGSLCDSQRAFSSTSAASGNMTSLHFQSNYETSLITSGFLRRGVETLEDLTSADTSWIVPRTARILIESCQKDLIIQQLKNQLEGTHLRLNAGMAKDSKHWDSEDHWMYGFFGQYFDSDDVMDSDKMFCCQSATCSCREFD